MHLPENARAARQGGSATKQDNLVNNATLFCGGKHVVNVDRDNAGVSALAIRLGAYAGMTDCIRRHSENGPHVAVHLHPVTLSGYVVVLLLFGGFPTAADNGWMCFATADAPGAADYLMAFATMALPGAPKVMRMSHEGRLN